MFRTLHAETKPTVTIDVEGENLQVPKDISVAAALLGHSGNHKDCRSSFISGEIRAPYCFMGVCHECLMEIDGKPNQQACFTKVKDGMQINKQHIKEGE